MRITEHLKDLITASLQKFKCCQVWDKKQREGEMKTRAEATGFLSKDKAEETEHLEIRFSAIVLTGLTCDVFNAFTSVEKSLQIPTEQE